MFVFITDREIVYRIAALADTGRDGFWWKQRCIELQINLRDNYERVLAQKNAQLAARDEEIDALKRECNLLYASINKPGKYKLPPKKSEDDRD